MVKKGASMLRPYLPFAVEVAGILGVLSSVAALADPWIAVGIGGIIAIGAGYLLEVQK